MGGRHNKNPYGLLRQAYKLQSISDKIIGTVNKVPRSIFDIETKDVYWELVGRIVEKPSAASKWEELYDLTEFDWESIYCTPLVARESTLQSFQYKVMHRFFPCNAILNTWYPTQSACCDYCNEIDTIEHYFVECNAVQLFWKYLFNWLNSTTKIHLHIKRLEIIFGIINENNLNVLNVINFCILFAKYYIYKQKKERKDIDFYRYQIELRNRLEIECIICTQQQNIEMFNEMWKDVLENL